jgi:adenylate cyclase
LGEARVARRLAAVFAADVAGYSRLMGADEEGTLRRLQAHRRELIDPKVREHKGRIVKTTGDGMLAEFPSVVDAVRCAVEAQRGMLDREADTAEEQRIRFRIGINLGDVIVDQGDIFGDGVNVAARLEALAEPGGLCVSGTVRDHIGDRLPYAFTALGEQVVKNIARPVPAFALTPAAIAATPIVPPKPPPPAPRLAFNRIAAIAAVLFVLLTGAGVAAWRLWPMPPSGTGEAKLAPRLSIVVLPFANLSNDPGQDYFVDSITDDLTTDLSRIEGSFVISRTTAFTYKGKSVDTKQIGHDLGVRYVLEGSVRRLGETVQVNAQLIDAETGGHVWADRFDTDLTNLAKAQSEIIGRLARTLRLELLESAGRQIAQEKNPDARDLIMRGWAWTFQPPTQINRQEAQQAFEQALELDPGSVGARVGIGNILVNKIAFGWSKSPDQDKARAQQLLVEALERDDDNAQAHIALGTLHRYQNRVNESQIELERGLALDRNHAGGMQALGWTLIALGRPEAAIPYFQKAIRVDPHSTSLFLFYAGLGNCQLLLGHVDEAVDALQRARAANPRIFYIHLLLAAALALQGDTDGANAALAEFLKLKPELNSLAKIRGAFPQFRGNPRTVALGEKTFEAGLRRAGLPEE